MNSEKVILSLVTILVLLAILLVSGVGDAAETDGGIKISDNILTTPTIKDFCVEFSEDVLCYGEGLIQLNITSSTTATINITQLEKAGDLAFAIITIKNKSEYLYADICAEVTNTNKEYFNVEATLSESKINPQNGETKLKISVELIKTPIEKEEKASIGMKISALPN